MGRRLLRGLVCALACALVLVALEGAPSQARGLKKISRITRVGQDWYNGKLKVSWKGARGVTYQWRYADSPSALVATRAVWSGTSRGTYTRSLDRGKTWFFQVRALKNGVVGPWSRARQLRFANRWPTTPRPTGTRLTGAVQWNWTYSAYASRYRVRWSPGWYGEWPGSPTYTTSGWLSQYARSSSYTVPTTPHPGDGMLAVPYANPVFGQVQAQNQYITNGAGIHQSNWVPVFPRSPAPAYGDPVRLGTYNTMVAPTNSRATGIARNISTHGVTIAALQESSDPSASAVLRALGASWSMVSTTSNTQQILYRNDKFVLRSAGAFDVYNPKAPAEPLVTPWARFSAKHPVSANSQSFYVSSVHYSENPSRTAMQKNADTGRAARETMSALSGIDYAGEPLVVAGDMRYGREPWGDVAGYVPAQPTFVRSGFYDAMASQSMHNYNYATVNAVNGIPTARQKPNPTGLGARADYIVMKGIVGSKDYYNVVNWSYGGVVPSDHNLIYSDIMIPTR